MTEAKKPAARKPRTSSTTTARGSSATKSDHTRRSTLEIKIGVQQSPREIVLDVDKTSADIEKALTEATTKGHHVGTRRRQGAQRCCCQPLRFLTSKLVSRQRARSVSALANCR